jgi:hypothetical protein
LRLSGAAVALSGRSSSSAPEIPVMHLPRGVPVSATRTARRPLAKVFGSVGVLAAAAAVAGLGTFGTFTDSTAPLAAEAGSGTVSIDLAAPASSIDFPDVAGGWLPGDRSFLPLDLVNTGTVDLSSIRLDVTATQSSLLDTDRTQGLQLTLDSCDQAWDTSSGSYTCAGTVSHQYSGPVVLSQQLPALASLRAGAVDHLLATVTLPSTAGNGFMGAHTDLAASFTGTQRTGAAR